MVQQQILLVVSSHPQSPTGTGIYHQIWILSNFNNMLVGSGWCFQPTPTININIICDSSWKTVKTEDVPLATLLGLWSISQWRYHVDDTDLIGYLKMGHPDFDGFLFILSHGLMTGMSGTRVPPLNSVFFSDVLRKCNKQGQYLSRGLDHSVSYTAVAEYACSTIGDALIDRFLEWESEVLTSRSWSFCSWISDKSATILLEEKTKQLIGWSSKQLLDPENPEPLRNTPHPLEWMEPRKTEEAGEPW